MKIAIIGYSGAGKSTLAQKIGKKYDIKVLHLDTVHFKENWIERKNEEEISITKKFLLENSSWVIDGNYSSNCYKQRLEAADKIIFIKMSRLLCLIRVLKRYNKYKGKQRDSAAKGCIEKIDLEFLKWVIIDGRTKRKRNNFKKLEKEYKAKFITVKTQHQINKLLKQI